MQYKDNSISFRPDIKIVDCTLRDGGLVNNFGFSDEFVKALYQANRQAGVDYMEFGYKSSKEIYKSGDLGKWKFCEEEDLRAIVGNNEGSMRISVMADVGAADLKKDLICRKDSVIDLVRIATYMHQVPTALEMIRDACEKGYETSVNIMAISKVSEEELDNGLKILAESKVDYIYLVDSFGAFYPEQIRRLTDKYMNIAAKYNKKIGIHTHNNQQLAYANTIESLKSGASLADASVGGMGRGAGNCHMESLLAFLNDPRYNLAPILDFSETYIQEEIKKGSLWGYDIPYLLTGMMNVHPSAAIKYVEEGRTDYLKFYQELLEYAE